MSIEARSAANRCTSSAEARIQPIRSPPHTGLDSDPTTMTDGSMADTLHAKGFSEPLVEHYNLTQAIAIEHVHRSFAEAGAEVALVRRALLIASPAELTPTNLVESVQLRVYGEAEQSFSEFRLDTETHSLSSL